MNGTTRYSPQAPSSDKFGLTQALRAKEDSASPVNRRKPASELASLDLRRMLSIPFVYTLFQRAARGRGEWTYVTKHLRPQEGDRILDIGCGTGYILGLFPKVEYLGFDMDERLVRAATKLYGDRGTFFCEELSQTALKDLGTFDIVSATGVLHHLPDAKAIELFELARNALKPEKRLVTLDGCYGQGQSFLGRLTLSLDRGKFVRTKEEYMALASKVFKHVSATVYPHLFRIPQAIVVMECRG